MTVTCTTCLGGRHGFRCEGRSDGSCGCNVCASPVRSAPKPVMLRQGYLDLQVSRPERKVQVPRKHEPRTWPKKPGPIPGAHGLKGRSSMSEEHQQKVVALLDNGVSISQIARSLGCSRDKIRTIKQRQQALKGQKEN